MHNEPIIQSKYSTALEDKGKTETTYAGLFIYKPVYDMLDLTLSKYQTPLVLFGR